MQVNYYFAYGSNMNPARVEERKLAFQEVAAGRLTGFELSFNKADKRHPGEGHANIMARRRAVVDAAVEGVLYKLESTSEILKMDPFERAPWNYGREVVQIQTPDMGSIWAWTYFANPAVQREGLKPSQDYMNHLLAGEPWLSRAYFERLQQWPVA